MTGISTSTEGNSVNNYDPEKLKVDAYQMGQELLKEPKEATRKISQASVAIKSNEEGMKIHEIVHKIFSLDLKDLEREQVLKIKLGNLDLSAGNAIELATELFKMKLETCKNAGINLEEFAKEAQTIVYHKGQLRVDDPHGELKAGLLGAYHKLYSCLQIESSAHNAFHLFELEKAVGFSVGGVYLLIRAIDLVLGLDPDWFFMSIPLLKRVISALEVEGKLEMVKDKLNARARNPKSENQLSQLLSGFSDYISLTNVDAYFEEQLQKILKDSAEQLLHPRWATAYAIVMHHCDAARLIVDFDQKRAQDHIKKAEKEINEHLWSCWLSWNHTSIEERREAALSSLINVKARIKQ